MFFWWLHLDSLCGFVRGGHTHACHSAGCQFRHRGSYHMASPEHSGSSSRKRRSERARMGAVRLLKARGSHNALLTHSTHHRKSQFHPDSESRNRLLPDGRNCESSAATRNLRQCANIWHDVFVLMLRREIGP